MLWGEKHHCTFCGLNGEVMLFRSKSAQKVLDELMTLSAKHEVLDFTAVDNILDPKYFDSLLPKLVERNSDISLFYETKANLKHHQVALLSAAGVSAIQPGIESLSTHVLQLMDKGVTALQNVRLLKWCAEFKIHVIWNLLYGFPGETEKDYSVMRDLLPSLEHFAPPTLSKLAVYRFSPHFNNPEKFGLVVDGPLPFYRSLFKVDGETLNDIAHSFRYHQRDGTQPEALIGELPQAVERWQQGIKSNYRALTYRQGPNFMRITDSRSSTTGGKGMLQYNLKEATARLYLACDAGATVQSIEREFRAAGESNISSEEIKNQLDAFVKERLMMEDNGKYLSLAVPFVPRNSKP